MPTPERQTRKKGRETRFQFDPSEVKKPRRKSKDCVLKAKGFLPVYMISDLLADIGVGIFVCILLVVLGLQIHGAVRNVKVSYSKKHD